MHFNLPWHNGTIHNQTHANITLRSKQPLLSKPSVLPFHTLVVVTDEAYKSNHSSKLHRPTMATSSSTSNSSSTFSLTSSNTEQTVSITHIPTRSVLSSSDVPSSSQKIATIVIISTCATFLFLLGAWFLYLQFRRRWRGPQLSTAESVPRSPARTARPYLPLVRRLSNASQAPQLSLLRSRQANCGSRGREDR
jgi:hypothetical protein